MDTRRIVVISDTHKDFFTLRKIVERHRQDTDLFLHLGDVEEDVRKIQALYPSLSIRSVRGNCDFGSKSKPVDIVELGCARILFCHGHTMFVSAGTEYLENAAREAGCNVALYGHTHVSYCRYKDGLYVMNPGSPSSPRDGKASYGIIDITETGLLPYVVKLN
ncbi:MAG TPA: YfcE family phosphodiesterase [Candidatus Faecivivens stercoripullorum]|uniref:Phosphoesterase n=1 Tax=Candidatus Faecivivens stercoripullorum TaxID=2840805 RepID=A0A9D1KSU8_9FIRM|nr:YfcE family phosphodiesterase [Candidatus Faecivivens stercoripullorum]